MFALLLVVCLRFYIMWFILTRLVGYVAVILGRVCLSYVMLLLFPTRRIVRLLFFPWTRRRPLIVLIGAFSGLRFLIWVLALPLFLGLIFFILGFAALFLLMVICLLPFGRPVVCGRVVPCHRSFTSSLLRFWRQICELTRDCWSSITAFP